MEALYVLSDYRQQGIGKEFIKYTELREIGVTPVIV